MSIRSLRRTGAILVLVLLLAALIVPAASAAPSEGATSHGCPVYHRVVRGDNLTKIAYRYGVSISQLQRWNNIWNIDRIYIGQSLVVWPSWCTHPQPKPQPKPQPQPGAPWLVQYFNNKDLSGAPVVSLASPSIAFNWGYGAPTPAVTPDNFSARFTNLSNLSGGTYRLWLRTDDGARVYVDSTLVIDAWRVQPVTGYFVDVPIPAGYHTFTVEYFENTQLAELHFNVQKR